MPPIIKLIQAIARLTQAGAIKKVEDAYKLAKRELGERFDFSENVGCYNLPLTIDSFVNTLRLAKVLRKRSV